MNRKLVNSTLVVLFSFTSIAFAHDGVVHKGTPIEGKATAIESTGFKVKSKAGEKIVEINKDTVFEIGMVGNKGTAQDLKDGILVMVEGTTLDSGVVVATEVMVHPDPASQSPDESTQEHKSH